MADPFIRTRLDAAARDFVPPEGEREFSNPDHYGLSAASDRVRPLAQRSLALKLVVMAMVMLGLLVAVILIFT